MDKTKSCIIAVCCQRNSWGRGQTIEEAKKNLRAAGGSVAGAKLRFIVGDDKAYVDNMGSLRATDAQCFKLTKD